MVFVLSLISLSYVFVVVKTQSFSLSGERGTLTSVEHLLCAMSFLELSSLILPMLPDEISISQSTDSKRLRVSCPQTVKPQSLE